MQVVVDTHDLAIRAVGPIHNGKVRSCYWLGDKLSAKIIEKEGYPVPPNSELGVLVISDRVSAFDYIWKAEGGLGGAPGKGAALNALSLHWFNSLQSLSSSTTPLHHVLGNPHPLAWIVIRADPVIKIEQITREALAGGMFRRYEGGERSIFGLDLSDGMVLGAPLPHAVFSPTTKGTLHGIDGVLEVEDAPLTDDIILKNSSSFSLKQKEDYTKLTDMAEYARAFISSSLKTHGCQLIDTKFEFGYIKGTKNIIYIDELVTPDSSRIWRDKKDVCKETFRQFLLETLDKPLLLNSDQEKQRAWVATHWRVPQDTFLRLSKDYCELAEKITGLPIELSASPKEDLLDALSQLGLVR